MEEPADYMAWGSCELAWMGRSGNGSGYFPTLTNVCMMITHMQMTVADKTKTVCDPCVRTGSMLLAASNYSLRLFGQDIDLNMVKMCAVKGFIFMPWLILPGHGLIDWNTDEDYREAIREFEQWKAMVVNLIPLIAYRPKSNTLDDWI